MKIIISNMDNLGILIDEGLNNSNPKEGLISHQNSKIKIAVIPTNEELIVADKVKNFLNNK
ncbi:MAG: hypothetical protein P8Z35_06275 [Ignavibacteriaceae bacterium]